MRTALVLGLLTLLVGAAYAKADDEEEMLEALLSAMGGDGKGDETEELAQNEEAEPAEAEGEEDLDLQEEDHTLDEEDESEDLEVAKGKHGEGDQILVLLDKLEKRLNGQRGKTKDDYDTKKARYENSKEKWNSFDKTSNREISLIKKIRAMVHNMNTFKTCFEVQEAGKGNGWFWIQPSSKSMKVYCKSGWTLVATIRKRSNQAHYNTARVNSNAEQGSAVKVGSSNTQKLSDTDIRAIRSKSGYKGPTGFKFTCFENGSERGGCKTRTMYCDSRCSFHAKNSVRSGRCSHCTGTFEGGFTQLRPNTGTRGMGHHHSSVRWSFAWQRHPEQGNNSGCRNDQCGGGDGHLWVR